MLSRNAAKDRSSHTHEKSRLHWRHRMPSEWSRVVVVSAIRNASTRPASTDGDRAAAPDHGTHVLPAISCFSPSTRLRILPSFLPSLQQTKYSLTHSTPPPPSIAASLAVRQQNRAKGKRVDRNLRSVCLSCCPPTMIDSLPRSSAIQRGMDADDNRTDGRKTVSAAVFLATSESLRYQTWGCNSLCPIRQTLCLRQLSVSDCLI